MSMKWASNLKFEGTFGSINILKYSSEFRVNHYEKKSLMNEDTLNPDIKKCQGDCSIHIVTAVRVHF